MRFKDMMKILQIKSFEEIIDKYNEYLEKVNKCVQLRVFNRDDNEWIDFTEIIRFILMTQKSLFESMKKIKTKNKKKDEKRLYI